MFEDGRWLPGDKFIGRQAPGISDSLMPPEIIIRQVLAQHKQLLIARKETATEITPKRRKIIYQQRYIY
jgi:hypothetical protein